MAVRRNSREGGVGENGAVAEDARRRRRYRIFGALALVTVGLAVLVLVWFQPQKLFLDDKVDEAVPEGVASSPTGEGSDGGTASPSASPAAPVAVASGSFEGRSSHSTTGSALLLPTATGSRILRLEDLRTDNGPDLRVYLSAAGADASGSALADDFVDLGALKGNIGSQNYEVPSGTDLGKYRTVVVWCRRFSVAFGVAGLDPR